jgi:hypothetical protein
MTCGGEQDGDKDERIHGEKRFRCLRVIVS